MSRDGLIRRTRRRRKGCHPTSRNHRRCRHCHPWPCVLHRQDPLAATMLSSLSCAGLGLSQLHEPQYLPLVEGGGSVSIMATRPCTLAMRLSGEATLRRWKNSDRPLLLLLLKDRTSALSPPPPRPSGGGATAASCRFFLRTRRGSCRKVKSAVVSSD